MINVEQAACCAAGSAQGLRSSAARMEFSVSEEYHPDLLHNTLCSKTRDLEPMRPLTGPRGTGFIYNDY